MEEPETSFGSSVHLDSSETNQRRCSLNGSLKVTRLWHYDTERSLCVHLRLPQLPHSVTVDSSFVHGLQRTFSLCWILNRDVYPVVLPLQYRQRSMQILNGEVENRRVSRRAEMFFVQQRSVLIEDSDIHRCMCSACDCLRCDGGSSGFEFRPLLREIPVGVPVPLGKGDPPASLAA